MLQRFTIQKRYKSRIYEMLICIVNVTFFVTFFMDNFA